MRRRPEREDSRGGQKKKRKVKKDLTRWWWDAGHTTFYSHSLNVKHNGAETPRESTKERLWRKRRRGEEDSGPLG